MPSALINVMSAAAIKASKGLLRDFGEVDRLQVSKKGASNFVTNADKRTEKLLIDELRKARPEFGFLAEESGEIKGSDATHRWIIDPLDGTSNFIHAIPYFCTAIALEKTTGSRAEIIAGIIYDPIHNELFHAERGRGAFVNDHRITVSRRDSFDNAMLVMGNPGNADASTLAAITAACRCPAGFRYTGATALDLAYIAAGRFDAGWFPPQHLWDVAAGWLLVQEAGGNITQINGLPYNPDSGTLLASSPGLQGSMLKLLAASA